MLCKHSVGMAYKEGDLDVTSQVRAVPLGQKRKRGHPKALGNCLLKSPPQFRGITTASPACTAQTSSPTAMSSPESVRGRISPTAPTAKAVGRAKKGLRNSPFPSGSSRTKRSTRKPPSPASAPPTASPDPPSLSISPAMRKSKMPTMSVVRRATRTRPQPKAQGNWDQGNKTDLSIL